MNKYNKLLLAKILFFNRVINIANNTKTKILYQEEYKPHNNPPLSANNKLGCNIKTQNRIRLGSQEIGKK